jgi:hypothetical protein
VEWRDRRSRRCGVRSAVRAPGAAAKRRSHPAEPARRRALTRSGGATRGRRRARSRSSTSGDRRLRRCVASPVVGAPVLCTVGGSLHWGKRRRRWRRRGQSSWR